MKFSVSTENYACNDVCLENFTFRQGSFSMKTSCFDRRVTHEIFYLGRKDMQEMVCAIHMRMHMSNFFGKFPF